MTYMEVMAKRSEQIKWAMKLNECLGDDYKVEHDVCESGMTYIYFKSELVKRVPNEEMNGSLNVCEYRVTGQWLWEHGFDCMGNKMNLA